MQSSLPELLQLVSRCLRRQNSRLHRDGLPGAAQPLQLLGPMVLLLMSSGSLPAQLVPVSGPLTLPVTNVGSSSTPQNILLKTTSAETISSFTVPVSQGNKQEYSVASVNGCAVDGVTSNPAGTVCTLSITFSPAYPGLRPVPLQVVTSAGKVNIGLNGMGVSPLAVLTPGTLSTLAGVVNPANCNAYSGPGLLGPICNPSAGAVDFAGNVYVAAFYSNTVSKIDTAGNVTVIAGTGAGGLSGVGGPATSATFDHPSDLVVDPAGNVYFGAETAQQIFRIDAVTQILTSVAGNGTQGYSGDNGPATQASLNRPEGVALDKQGNLYIEDQDNNLIRKVDTLGIITTVAGNPKIVGQASPIYGGDGGLATQAGLALCCGGIYASYDSITVDAAGNLFIGDSGHHVVREVTTDGIIHTVAGNNALGGGFAGDGGSAINAQLNLPMGVFVDPAGDLYIADFSNNRIRKVDAATQTITTVAGNGTQGSAGSGPATQVSLNGPQKIVLDGKGNLYVADTKNNLIRKSDVSNPTVTFPTSTPVGTTDTTDGPLGVVLANIGNAPLTLPPPATGTNPSVSAGFSLYTGESGACPALTSSSAAGTLTQGSSCELQGNFTPVSVGSVTGSLVLTDNSLNTSSPLSTQTVTLIGTAPSAPQPVLTPATMDFANVPILTTSTAQTATLQNTGTAALPVLLFNFSGNNPGGFSETDNCGHSLAAGASCSISVTCIPVIVETLTATLHANFPSPIPQQSIALTCNATAPAAPQAALTPATTNFGSVQIGQTATQTLTLTNAGNAALPITGATISGTQYSIAITTCGVTLAAGASCSYTVVFTPIAVTTATATFSVTDSVGTQSSTLTGAGTAAPAPQAVLTPAANFGSVQIGQTVTQTLTLTNAGNATLPITIAAISGTQYTVASTTCGATLAAGASCSYAIVFTPIAVTSATATFSVTDSVGTQSSVLTGAGTAAPAPQAVLTPAASFGSVQIGQTVTQTLTLTNAGTAALPITLASVAAGPFTLTGKTCSTSLAAGSSCTFMLTFAPTLTGAQTAIFSVVDSVGTQASALTGTATAAPAPQAALTPATVTFGNIPANTTAPAQVFTLTNAGSAALPITSTTLTGTGFTIIASTCSTTLAAGTSCTLSVTFSPAAVASYTATLSVVDSVGTQSSNLTGTGTLLTQSDFTITPSPSAQSSYRGQSVTYTVALASLTGSQPFTGTVVLTATGLPSGATATFSPATVVPGASTTFTVAVPTLSGANRSFRRTGVAFAALLFGIVLTRRKRITLRLLLIPLALVTASTLQGCGTGNGYAIPTSTSLITITGTSGSVVHTTTVTLTVQ